MLFHAFDFLFLFPSVYDCEFLNSYSNPNILSHIMDACHAEPFADDDVVR